MATAKPGPPLKQALDFVTGERAEPPKRFESNASTNWYWLGLLSGVLRDHGPDVVDLTRAIAVQLGELTPRNDREHRGLYGDETGGGYAAIQDAIILGAILYQRRGGSLPATLVDLCRQRYGAGLKLRSLLAVPYRDSIHVAGPGSRLRTPWPTGLSEDIQLVIGAPSRRFGIRGNSPQDQVEYFWRDADKEAAALRKLMGVPPHKLAAECGVDHRELAQWIARPSAERGISLAAGLRSLYPLRIRRYREHGALAAWWEVFASHDAPHAGSVVEGDSIHALQPQPIGPRAGKDHQHWSPRDRDDNLVPQTCEIKGRELVATFTTAAGIHNSAGSPVKVQERKVRLPAGDAVLDLLIDLDGAREVSASQRPAPTPPRPAPRPAPRPPVEPPQPGTEPRPEPPRRDGSVQRILDAFLLMRVGKLPGGADAMERVIRGEM